MVRGTFVEGGCGCREETMAHPKEFAEGLSIGIIMDGNGRWAKNRGLPRTAGHKRGAEVFSDIADYCDELGVASVYFYAFSTENWKRPLEEVNAIMRLFGEYLLKGFDYKNRNIRIKFLGDRTVLDPKLQELMNKLEAESSVKTGMTLNIAINYGGRPEIVRAAQQLAAKAAAGELKPEDITYINAHGTSTHLNDMLETKAVKIALGEEQARKVKINSTKSMTGHMLGGTGAVEAAVCALSIRDSFIHQTIGYTTPDPECDLDYCVDGPVEMPVNAALSNSLGFGGHNATLCFKKCTD